MLSEWAEDSLRAVPSLALAASLLLTGCANTTAVQLAANSKSAFEGAVFSGEVVPLEKATPGNESYRVFQQGATGFVSIQSVRSGVEGIATDFCARKVKAMRGISETDAKPPYILGNFPRVELIFECVDKPAGATVSSTNRYDKVAALKKLLDSGALTQQEFESEKAKVLAAPQ